MATYTIRANDELNGTTYETLAAAKAAIAATEAAHEGVCYTKASVSEDEAHPGYACFATQQDAKDGVDIIARIDSDESV